MVKFSFIIPTYGTFNDNNFQHCIESLLQQTNKDFEIIISGNKIIDNIEQTINGIKIKNIVINTNKIGKLMNEGIKISDGEYIHLWNLDLIVYPDYIEKLNNYISEYGKNNLYAGHIIDTRSINNRSNSNNFYFNSFDKPEGFFCLHRNYMGSFREEFEGFATHWCQELCFRLWKKMKFICMQNVEVIHLPHSMRISYEQSIIDSQRSSQLFEVMKNEIHK